MSRHITLSISIVLIKYFSEMNNMSFVNKFITDEKEIQKFDLDNVYNACDLGPGNRKWPEARLDGSDRPNLTIDRERNIWLMHPGVIHSYENSRSGYPEPTGVYVFILHYSGKIMNSDLNVQMIARAIIVMNHLELLYGSLSLFLLK
ncbi:hypothetical protein ACEZEZ_16330 [Kluyvera ascorbata]|uniref:hypothetical protein n=1 Tax=Kluyvera ascorbata TaxID=51288 RepID=UPI0035CD202A